MKLKVLFYLVIKDKNRIVHGFSITQKLDPIILYSIKYLLKIRANVKYNSKGFFSLDCYNTKNIKYIIDYFTSDDDSNLMKGSKSLEFSLWKRSYRKYFGNYSKLLIIIERIKNLRK